MLRPVSREKGHPYLRVISGLNSVECYTRGKNHESEISVKKDSNALYKHAVSYHEIQVVPY